MKPLFILFLFTLTVMAKNPHDKPPPPPPPPSGIVLDKALWEATVGSHITHLWLQWPLSQSAKGQPISFTIPQGTDYVTGAFRTYQSVPLRSYLKAQVSISTAGVFVRDPEAGNTCPAPATMRFYVFQSDYADNHRWWSNPIALEMKNFSAQYITVPITPDQWSQVYGQFGNSNAQAQQGWNETMARPYSIGFAFGANCYFGHGVQVIGDSATFTMYSISTGP